jgi:hypothetical protein
MRANPMYDIPSAHRPLGKRGCVGHLASDSLNGSAILIPRVADLDRVVRGTLQAGKLS